LVVAEPGFFAVTAADRALKLAAEMHEEGVAPRLQPLGLAVNRYRPRSVEHQYRLAELRELFGDAVLEPVIEERVGLQGAHGGGGWVRLPGGGEGGLGLGRAGRFSPPCSPGGGAPGRPPARGPPPGGPPCPDTTTPIRRHGEPLPRARRVVVRCVARRSA